MREAYVYAIVVDGVRRYVGKGRGQRVKMHMKIVRGILRRRAVGEVVQATILYNKLAKAWRNGSEIEIEIIVDGLTNEGAFAREIFEIKSSSKDQLWNMTPGGYGGGAKGNIHAPETRAKIAQANRKTWSDPILLQEHSNVTKLFWSRPDYKGKRGATMPETAKQTISEKAKLRWADPSFREKMTSTYKSLGDSISERTKRSWITRRSKTGG